MTNTSNYSYEYFRSIGRTMKFGREFFIGFVTIKKSEVLYDASLKQSYKHRIESVDFSIIEETSKVHPLIRQLPSGDVTHDLSSYSYEVLKELSLRDEVSFWLYLTTFTASNI